MFLVRSPYPIAASTQFVYTFGNDPIDAFPSGFYESGGTAAFANWQVKAVAGTMGGKVLQFDGGLSSNQNTFLSIAELDDKDFVEILGRVRVLNLPSATSGYDTASLVPKHKESGDHYRFNLRHISSTATYQVAARKNVAGSVASIATDNADWTINEWVMLRIRQTSTDIHYKFWKANVAEPSNWTRTIAETQITGPGKVGIAALRGNAAIQFDWVSVGIDDATAPTPIG